MLFRSRKFKHFPQGLCAQPELDAKKAGGCPPASFCFRTRALPVQGRPGYESEASDGLGQARQLARGSVLVKHATGNATSQFTFGFTSSQAFSSFTLSGAIPVGQEAFNLDGLQAVSPTAVPEPGTFGLVGLAMVGLGLLRRARR